MRHLQRSPLDWIVLGLLAVLAMTNTALLLLLRTGGPLIGLAFYSVLLALALQARLRDHRPLVAGGLVGLAVHLVEVATMGWSDQAVLVGLNLVLPAALALAAWTAGRESGQVDSNE